MLREAPSCRFLPPPPSLPPPLKATWPLPLLSPLTGNMALDMAVFSVSQLHVEWLAKLLPQDRVYLGKVSVGMQR